MSVQRKVICFMVYLSHFISS